MVPVLSRRRLNTFPGLQKSDPAAAHGQGYILLSGKFGAKCSEVNMPKINYLHGIWGQAGRNGLALCNSLHSLHDNFPHLSKISGVPWAAVETLPG